MKWLDDLAQSRKDAQAKAQREHEEFTRARARTAKSVNSMVKRMLKQVGAAYWGSVGEASYVERGGDGYTWQVGNGWRHNHDYWSVTLERRGEQWVLLVHGSNKSIATTDLSADALDAALKEAVRAGPCAHREY